MRTTDSGSPLFYLAGATEGATQWKAETLQLVNWGGFHGHSTVTFAPTTTLLSGASGTGKSTLLDAYIALMMDSNVPFNGASNDATVGRARSADQRSLISYLRGKTDTSRNSEGDLADEVLRGHNTPTWGALAMTFVDDNQRRFTLTRLYYVPRTAARDGELVRKLCTVDGTIDLRAAEQFAKDKFDKRAVEGRFTSLKMYKSYDEFSQAFFSKLGIGANGDGGKALRLLARIQAGHQVRTVDDLYKSMVIELPGTYAAADDAVDHFKNLEDAYKAMETEQAKADVLQHIPRLYDDRARALDASSLLDSLGYHEPGDSPFSLWKLLTEDQLLEKAENDNRDSRNEAKETKAAAERKLESLEEQHEQIIEALRDNDSHKVVTKIDDDLGKLRLDLDDATKKRDTFDTKTARLGLAIENEQDFARAQQLAQEFVDGFDRVRSEHDERLAVLQNTFYEPRHEKGELLKERESLAHRDGRMDRGLHETRLLISEATGIPPEMLPFVGELIDVLPNQRKWRKAIETTLFGLARVLLVDANELKRFSDIIDPLKLPRRVNYEGVDVGSFLPQRPNAAYVSGKLAYKNTPFTAWVQERLSSPNTDALCVDSADQLGGSQLRVTENGQTRQGRSGAHGELKAPYVIGFSKEERLAEIADQIEELDEVLDRIGKQLSDHKDAFTALLADKTAHEHVLDTQWKAIDPDGILATISELERKKQKILNADDSLRELRTRLGVLDTDIKTERGHVYAAKAELERLGADQDKIIKRKDFVVGQIQRVEREQAASLADHQKSYLDTEFARVADPEDRTSFASGVGRLKDGLAKNRQSAQGKADSLKRELEAVFQRYLDSWGDPNLSASVENYPSFRSILDNIIATGLHERRQEWAKRLTDWSGQDLVPLAGAFSNAIDDIHNRLAPVNVILRGLPFGAHRHRLKIDLRELNQDDIVKFKRELKILSRANTDDFSDDQIQNWFKRLQKFMARIRKDSDAKNNRDRLLDVRKHIEITAISYDEHGQERSTYAALGGKSGGETQELVAFIVGAALRFQLGDEAHERPRFAPVFLDEGFVKADSEFAGRAVDAWKGLGFQLIIGAPYGQFTALEPHADSVLYMAKNTKGHSSVKLISPTTSVAKPQDEVPA